MIQKIDLWLRSVWSLWDTHGTRIIGIAGFLHAAISSVAAALTDLKPKTAAILLAVSGVLGAMTIARGQTNSARNAPTLPPPAQPPGK